MNAYLDVLGFIDSYGSGEGNDAMNRMIFMQGFSAFEAFLCDTYFNLVFENEVSKKLFLSTYKELKKSKLSFEVLLHHKELTASEIIDKIITQKIKEILFHNLGKTISLYKIYKINIFPNSDVRDFLFTAVEYRHHCVHRNGKDKDGNELSVFTKDYIQKTIEIIMETASFIDGKIREKECKEMPF